MRNEEIIKDIAELIAMAFKYNYKTMTVEKIQEKIKQFNDWNNGVKFYELALNLTQKEQQAICNQVCSWGGLYL